MKKGSFQALPDNFASISLLTNEPTLKMVEAATKVEVNGRGIGSTGSKGTISFTILPADVNELEIKAKKGELE